MPNFHAQEFSLPSLPLRGEDTSFEFSAHAPCGEVLVMSECHKQKLLLKIQKSKKGFLIKGDKITRPSQVSILQKALLELRELTNTKSFYSNIESKKQKNLEISPFLKKMDYFADEFQTSKEILVEVGFGSGRHLLYQAKQNPEKLVIGLEIHKPSIEQVLKQCELQKIENILVVDYDARVFLEFLSSNSVSRIFVHFPVPWDKKPHRRVISERFIEEAIRVLKKNGTLELRTDSDNYFEYSFFEFMKPKKVKLEVYKNRELQVSSKYEDRWKRQEKNIYDITLENLKDCAQIEKIGRLKFPKNLDFSNIQKNFQRTLVRGVDCFAHIEEIFVKDEQSGFIRVSFGGGQKNEHCYIYIDQGKVSYFPDNILATKDNVNAHKLIEEILYGKCN
jgi:tRNA (guanine-N7-)-methyltransferase